MPTKHERKVAERVAAAEAGDLEKITRIDARENERRKWKAYHPCVRKSRTNPFKVKKLAKNNYSRSGSSEFFFKGALPILSSNIRHFG